MEGKSYTVREFKDYIKTLDIVEVLEKCEAIDESDLSGRKMICPFHNENTPSLHFYEDNYHCYGCGTGGDVFKFLIDIYDISFIQAVQLVSEKYGVNLKLDSTNPFLTPNHISTSRLEEEWKKYVDDLINADEKIKQGAKIFFPLEVGYDKSERYYVLRFTSKTGKTLGFTKRRAFETNDKSTYPKWVHSSDNNSNISQCAKIYNLGNAVKHIRETKHLIIVEGPKDVIPWMKEGKKEVLSVSGTHNFIKAFQIIPTFNTITLSLDSDDAGKTGMFDATVFLSDKTSLDNITYVDLKDLDPYDYYKTYGKMPDEKPIYDLLTGEGMKVLYSSASDYNKELLVSKYAKEYSLSYKEAESFFKMGDTESKNKKKEDEKQKLLNSKDESALDKLRIKYGVK